MVKAAQACPNLALVGLRAGRGETQQEVADALSALAAAAGMACFVSSNQISRWERGTNRPVPFFRRLLAQHFEVPVPRLGFSRLPTGGIDPDPVADPFPVAPPTAATVLLRRVRAGNSRVFARYLPAPAWRTPTGPGWTR